ncbi:helix-turn-helix transcriptional regulator [Kutzneria buriramensis]|uniref:Transcriptional regulator with XRE-family HTH domain n=1 Tax=Kutzneria buriramensis TaxID=1045776 RepID=A0A3E0HES1_9PSEU|nr:helix-turn-helix transcriptional regulator [Kutzneria buriramensis]REH43663.1 transcriptional regulator with XRE-family HTH domain [Kutzneria buriramensis]
MTNFEAARLEFGDVLRRLREQGGLDGKDLASRLGWHPSKVSKIERGRQTVTDSDLLDILGALAVPDVEAERLRQDLRTLRLKQLAWRRQLRAGHRDRQRQDLVDEQTASTIRIVDLMAVPGVLQTPDYAPAIFVSQAALLEIPAGDIDEAIAVRMQRQHVLYDSSKTIEILIAEAALMHPVCTPAQMAAQVDRLVSATSLTGVRVGLLPAYRPVPHLLPHGFWIVDDVVSAEKVTGEDRETDPEQVAVYERLTDSLWSVAVTGDDARGVLLAVGRRWAELAR